MLRSLKDIEDYKVTATDGDIGSVSDFYFDDHHWTIRYLVVDTSGFWQAPSRVMISPVAFREAQWTTQKFHLALTRDKVQKSPAFKEYDSPTHGEELDYYQYYNWPHYWGYSGIWGDWSTPVVMGKNTWTSPKAGNADKRPHLRRVLNVIGSRIQGSDDEIGTVQDFIVDDETWTIRYIVIDVGNWWSGKSVILAPHWIDKISEKDDTVFVNLPRDKIKNSPEWKADQPVNREYETKLFDYYGRPTYWNS